ncbi:transposase [Salinisphaera sp.]|uniref:transposase n=1 Tax=Salinisphaera sp. TaxID=1914330 RepID=UPI002D7735B0|nr:transposase [Salinisphaera sp.]HET7313253.1 transposase [Salinisphaera sp.]
MTRKPYKRYTKEFKLEALRLAEQSEKPVTAVARELGLRVNQIYKWKQQLESNGSDAFPGKGWQAGLEAENARLRQELECSREENQILKKAAAYFAKESL